MSPLSIPIPIPIPSVLLVLLVLFLNLPSPAQALPPRDSPQQVRPPPATSATVDIHNHILSASVYDPLALNDVWASLTDAQRTAWTSAYSKFKHSDGIPAASDALAALRKRPAHLHLDVQLVPLNGLRFSEKQIAMLQRYATAMRAGDHRVAIKFSLSVASNTLSQRISIHLNNTTPTNNNNDQKTLTTILQQQAASLAFRNALFILLPHSTPQTTPPPSPPHPTLSQTRLSYATIPISKAPNLPRLLHQISGLAHRIYTPSPLYTPLPLRPTLHLNLAAYTPRHFHRALCLRTFPWPRFEAAVRTLALSGQPVRFFSTQTNAECLPCAQAFRTLENTTVFNDDFISRAVKFLNGGLAPSPTWATPRSSSKTPPDTFHIYMLDTAKLRKSPGLTHLERTKPLSVFPGIALIILRSTDTRSLANLHNNLIAAVLGGVYGVAQPSLYMHPVRTTTNTTAATMNRPSLILFDVIARNLVSSAVARHFAALDHFLQAILYFSLDPAKALGEYEYTRLIHRINLLLFKLEHAQQLAADPSDTATALYLAAAASHDIKAMRSAFDISTNENNLDNDDEFDRFRDPTLRCHFSRLRREALRASQLLEAQRHTVKHLAWGILSFSVSALLTYAGMSKNLRRKLRGKRE